MKILMGKVCIIKGMREQFLEKFFCHMSYDDLLQKLITIHLLAGKTLLGQLDPTKKLIVIAISSYRGTLLLNWMRSLTDSITSAYLFSALPTIQSWSMLLEKSQSFFSLWKKIIVNLCEMKFENIKKGSFYLY